MGTEIKKMPLVLILLAVFGRLLPHIPNMAPVAAVSLFGAAYLPRKFALIIPLVSLVISDLFLGFYGFTMFFVYSGFVLTGVIGLSIRNKITPYTVLGSSLAASVVFFLLSNFGVWANPDSWYSKDFTGLIQCYAAAIPFFRNTVLGDFLYVSGLFTVYHFVNTFASRWRLSRNSA